MKHTSRLITDLVPEMQEKAEQVFDYCNAHPLFEKQSAYLEIYCTFRSLEEQARLYCNGAKKEVVKLKADYLRNDLNMDVLADILEEANDADVDEDDTLPATKALPGQSFHNYGLAFDAAPVIGGKYVWDEKSKLYQVYGEAVREAGLFWAGLWPRFREFPHAQLVQETNALRYFKPGVAMAKLREIGAV